MIKELHEKLVNREITSTELVEEYFSRIEEKNKDYFAYLTLLKEEALKNTITVI